MAGKHIFCAHHPWVPNGGPAGLERSASSACSAGGTGSALSGRGGGTPGPVGPTRGLLPLLGSGRQPIQYAQVHVTTSQVGQRQPYWGRVGNEWGEGGGGWTRPLVGPGWPNSRPSVGQQNKKEAHTPTMQYIFKHFCPLLAVFCILFLTLGLFWPLLWRDLAVFAHFWLCLAFFPLLAAVSFFWLLLTTLG